MLTFLWCVPRSISTAFEKMMAYSGKFDVIGEPFIDTYKQSLVSKNGFLAAQDEFAEKFSALLIQSMSRSVFVKDMAYHASPFITDEQIKAVNNTFLIRDPRLSIPSLYRMRPDFAEPETGFEGQFELFQRIRDVTGKMPHVADGEMLTQYPQRIIDDYFGYIDQDMESSILSWPQGSRADWVGRESWHLHAIESRGFELKINPKETKNLPQRVKESIARNSFFYESMYKHRSVLN